MLGQWFFSSNSNYSDKSSEKNPPTSKFRVENTYRFRFLQSLESLRKTMLFSPRPFLFNEMKKRYHIAKTTVPHAISVLVRTWEKHDKKELTRIGRKSKLNHTFEHRYSQTESKSSKLPTLLAPQRRRGAWRGHRQRPDNGSQRRSMIFAMDFLRSLTGSVSMMMRLGAMLYVFFVV